MHRSTCGSYHPTPPLASESRLSRTETVKSARRPSKMTSSLPPALPTTWTQACSPLKMILTPPVHLSTTHRA